jgi:pectate lyase
MITRDTLLSERIGWGRNAVGGDEPRLVTSLTDHAPGSLRDVIGSGGGFITTGLAGDLVLDGPLDVPANTTIALGGGVTFRVLNHHHGLRFLGSNIIVAHNRFEGDWLDWRTDAEGSDGIHIMPGVEDFIISDNFFTHWADGAIDTETGVGIAARRGSIVRNKASDIGQPFNLVADEISFGFNLVADYRVRAPKIQAGRIHSYNNLFKRWEHKSTQITKDGGQLVSDLNMWVAGIELTVNTFDGPILMGTQKVFSGSVNFLPGPSNVDPAFVTASRANSGMTTPTTSAEWKTLRGRVQDTAGPRY